MNLVQDATVSLVEHANQMAKLRAELTRADLRDQFAMAALTGFIIYGCKGVGDHEWPVVAGFAYEVADAMLAAR